MQPIIVMNAAILDRHDAPLKVTTVERPAPGKGARAHQGERVPSRSPESPAPESLDIVCDDPGR
jgi:hypothetical protein